MPMNPGTNRPAVPYILLASAARTTSSNTSSLKDTVNQLPMAESMSIGLSVSAYTVSASKVTGRAVVYLDTSPDGGTTWLQALEFAQVTTSTATQIINFRNGIGIAGEASFLSDRASTTTSARIGNVALTRDVRVRWDIGDGSAAGNGISITFAVFAFANPD